MIIHRIIVIRFPLRIKLYSTGYTIKHATSDTQRQQQPVTKRLKREWRRARTSDNVSRFSHWLSYLTPVLSNKFV